MTESENPFVMENCVLVTSNSASITDLRYFIRENFERVFSRGNHASSKLMILSGCHGTVDGSDGVNNLECLSTTDESSMNQTRKFYQDICRLFGLQPEGDDPRIYNVFLCVFNWLFICSPASH